jgi:PadR family transcriptional regulator PadR
MLSAADHEIRLGLWKIHILHHAARREVWGTWLLEELAAHGHKLSPGTLYPALTRMTRNGWLIATNRASHPRSRHVLRITPAGRRLLRALRRDVAELHAEVVLGQGPGRAPSSSRRAGRPPESVSTNHPRRRR